MESTTPPQAEEPTRPADLRAELFQDLAAQFASALSSKGTLPATAQKALFELLDSDAPTAAEIITGASKNDPIKEEVGDE